MLLHLNISTKCHMVWPFQKLFKISSQIHLTISHKTQVSNSKRSRFLTNLFIECVCCHDVRDNSGYLVLSFHHVGSGD